MRTLGNTSAKLPADQDSEPIQVLAPDYPNAVNGTSGAVHATVTLPVNQDILLITNTQDMWITFGGASDTPVASVGGSGCILLLAGERLIQTPRKLTIVGSTKVFAPVTKMDAIQASAAGNFTVVGMG